MISSSGHPERGRSPSRGTLLTIALILAALSTRASAQDAPAVIAAITAPTDDVRKAILVGPSGQLWEPDGAGAWIRRSAGGVAADVRGAALASGALVLAGKATPLYRRDGDRWSALRLGERGKTAVGRGPRPSLSIGRLVFVWTGTTWKRVAAAPGVVTATWAASETKVVIATDAGLWRLTGGAFRAIAPLPGSIFVAPIASLDGASATSTWAVSADGAAIDVGARRAHRPTVGGATVQVALVASTGGSTWALGATDAGPALARYRDGAWSQVAAPPLTVDDPAVALAADSTGALLVVTRGGAILLAGADGTWTAGTRTEALPTAAAGPGPARMR